MFTIEIILLSFFSFVSSQRYYAFVETLFVIDRYYFPQLSAMSYEEYVHTIVDTTNIIFQSQNDLDIKIEIIVSNIVYLNIVQPKSQEPYLYEETLRQHISDYDKYDSIVLLWYQPWEGPNGAQGYAMLKGVCHPSYKIMYLLPYQNAAFYLAHEFGHQLGLVHQIDSSCFTKSHMSVMTNTHTVSYEQAHWTPCENDWINKHICEYSCLFNKPNNYQPIKSKHSTLPGQRMKNDQQAKMIEPNQQSHGEVSSYTYMPSDLESRCLYFQYYIGGSNGGSFFVFLPDSNSMIQSILEYKTAFSPMLPGSDCGPNAICYLDKCVSRTDLDPSLFLKEYDTNILDLTTYCNTNNDPNTLKSTNHDRHPIIQCLNWENEFLCASSRPCPQSNDMSVIALYTRHLCCQKCSSQSDLNILAFNHATKSTDKFSTILFIFLFLFNKIIFLG